MKALHLIAGKDPLRKNLHYIQVRGGFVYVTEWPWEAAKPDNDYSDLL